MSRRLEEQELHEQKAGGAGGVNTPGAGGGAVGGTEGSGGVAESGGARGAVKTEKEGQEILEQQRKKGDTTRRILKRA